MTDRENEERGRSGQRKRESKRRNKSDLKVTGQFSEPR